MKQKARIEKRERRDQARRVRRTGKSRRPPAAHSRTGQRVLPLRVPAHRATTINLQALFPFVIETGLGATGAYIGSQCGSGGSFCFDPWQAYNAGIVTNPNVLLAGVIGRGKSALAKTLALRLSAFGVGVYVPGDPKGEWGPVAETLGVQPLRLGRGLPARVNPLDTGPRPTDVDPDEWGREVVARRHGLLGALAETALDRRLTPVERSALLAALSDTGRRTAAPVLPDVVQALLNPTPDAAAELNMTVSELITGSRDLALELRRLVVGDLAGLFDGPTTHRLDFTAPIQVLDTSRLVGDDTAIALLMTCASAWMETAVATPGSGHRLVVYDEAWRMLRHLPLVRRMQAQWKLSRTLGVANLAVVHRISDLGAVGSAGSEAVALAQGLLADCSTRIVYAQETDQVNPTAAALGLTDVEADLLPQLGKGRGLWKIGRHSVIVDHHMTPAERAVTNTDQAMDCREPR